jgi:hypothetical protein
MAYPDYGDAGIYREGHRASSKAKPRRDATFVPRIGDCSLDKSTFDERYCKR